MHAKKSIKRKSFALIRVIRGQTRLFLLFQGGTRCPSARRSVAKAAQRVGKRTLRFRRLIICTFGDRICHRSEPDWHFREKPIHLGQQHNRGRRPRLQPFTSHPTPCATRASRLQRLDAARRLQLITSHVSPRLSPALRDYSESVREQA